MHKKILWSIATVKNLFSYSPIHLFTSKRKRPAFTLAEVLITLGIIGVVAAITLPTLIQNHRKSVVEARLKKFYSVMNQAIVRSELDNGPKELWWKDEEIASKCEDDVYSEECLNTFFDKYLRNYIKFTKTEYNLNNENDQHALYVYFSDGTKVGIKYVGRDYIYYIYNKVYIFGLYPDQGTSGRYLLFNKKGIEPYLHQTCTCDVNTIECLKGCGAWLRIIQINGWKIPDDYPYKF